MRQKGMHWFYTEDIEGGLARFDAQSAHHIVRVLRHRVGDLLYWTDGRGKVYEGVLKVADARGAVAEVRRIEEWRKPWRGTIHMGICLLKQRVRMEWLVEKLTEIGVDAIHLLHCHHCERTEVRVEKLRLRAQAAALQSLKARFPAVYDVKGLDAFLSLGVDVRLIAHCRDGALPAMGEVLDERLGESYGVLIGPEGDFSADEIEEAAARGWVGVRLGGSRLRSETAALVACTALHLLAVGD